MSYLVLFKPSSALMIQSWNGLSLPPDSLGIIQLEKFNIFNINSEYNIYNIEGK